MPVLQDPKRERFAQGVARGLPTIEAYVRAGYKRNTGNATSMRKRPDVAARIDEIQKQMREQTQQDLQDYLDESGVNYTYIIKQVLETAIQAKSAGKYADAMNGFKEVGKELFGMFVDRKNISVEQNVNNNSTTTISIQDFTASFTKLAEALDGPQIEGTFMRLDESRTPVPIELEPAGSDD